MEIQRQGSKSSLYFCKDKDEKYFTLAKEQQNNPLIARFSKLSKELKVVLPISYFEKSGNDYFNSLVVIDADEKTLGNYRKSHIPDGTGYEEKFYFKKGDTGFKVFDSTYAKIGVGICWDQWFPECSRAMALLGAQLLMFPTAIGDEPDTNIDSKGHWQRVQQGHAAANITPIISVNRVGAEIAKSCSITFYGSSFMSDERGLVVTEASRDNEEIIYTSYDLEKIATLKEYWGLFQDRRTDLY